MSVEFVHHHQVVCLKKSDAKIKRYYCVINVKATVQMAWICDFLNVLRDNVTSNQGQDMWWESPSQI